MKKTKIEFAEICEGSGTLAAGEVWVRVRLRLFLNRGEEVSGLWGAGNDGICFHLTDRETIAGLRYGVTGMRVGGRREVVIGPHLAFGESGIPGVIPPHALLRGEFELLEVGQPGDPIPMPPMACPGRSLSITAWSEEASRLPRWTLTFHDRQHPHFPSQCSLALEWSTRRDGKWGSRTAQRRAIGLTLDAQEIDWLIEAGKRLPTGRAADCLQIHEVHSHGGESPTRANADSVVCWSVALVEQGTYHALCYLRENSPLWTGTVWGQRIMALIQPHLTEAPWRQRVKER